MKKSQSNSGNLWKGALAVLLLAAAVGVWHWSKGDERAALNEAAEAVVGTVYLVKCSACENQFEMPAPDYVAQLEPEGVECPKCGKRAARMLRDAEEVDPEIFREEANKIATAAEIQVAVENNRRELDASREALAAAEAAGDTGKAAELRKQKNTLVAKDHALNQRWEDISRAAAGP